MTKTKGLCWTLKFVKLYIRMFRSTIEKYTSKKKTKTIFMSFQCVFLDKKKNNIFPHLDLDVYFQNPILLFRNVW